MVDEIKSAQDLLNRYPVSGRHFRHNYPLYASRHVLHFANECARASCERVKILIADRLSNQPNRGELTDDEVKEIIMEIKVQDVLK